MSFEQLAAKRLAEIEKEESEAKRTGFHHNDYCWTCKEYFETLRWVMCGNGTLTYHCEKDYQEIMNKAKNNG